MRGASFPRMMALGGFVFDFELFRTASGPSRRVVSERALHAIDATVSAQVQGRLHLRH